MGQFQEEKKKHNLEYSGNTHKKNQVAEGNLGMNNLWKRGVEGGKGGLLVGCLGQ